MNLPQYQADPELIRIARSEVEETASDRRLILDLKYKLLGHKEIITN